MSTRSIAKGTKHRYFQRIGYTTPAPSAVPTIIEDDEPSYYQSRPSTVQQRRKSTALSRRTEGYTDDDDGSQHPNYIPADPYHENEDVYEDPIIDPDPDEEHRHYHDHEHTHTYEDGDPGHMCLYCVANRLRRKKARDNTCISCAADRFRTYRRNPQATTSTKRSKSLDTYRSPTPVESLEEKKPKKKGKSKKNKSGEKFKVKDDKRRMANNKKGPPKWQGVGDPTQRGYLEKWKSDFEGDHTY